MHDHQTEHDDLAWQAFRYVAGEMSAAEQEHFDALLAEDQDARQAVASAYELTQATALALAVKPVVSPRPVGRRAGERSRWAWLAVSAAACVAVVLVYSQWPQPKTAVALAENDALAAQWSAVREQQTVLPTWAEEASSAAVEPTPADAWAEPLGTDADNDVADAAAPEWMLAAVFEQRSASDQGELPGDIESRSEESQEQ